MSLDASRWAWTVELKEKPSGARIPLKRLVLLSLADRAGEDHCCYPSMQRLESDTGLERKTVLKIIAELQEDNLIVDTGERKGATKRVKVYRLVGVNGRETVPTTEPLNDENTPEIVPKTEQSQKRNDSNNGTLNSTVNGTLNSAVNGTQNLPMNLPVESKNKKHWLCLKKLREEIFLIDDQLDFDSIVESKWYVREMRAFELYNADKNFSDDLMIYHAADWIVNAYRSKYTSAGTKSTSQPSTPSNGLSEKQIAAFAQKLTQHPEFSSRYSEVGETFDSFAARIAKKLKDPAQAKKWEGYLKQVGYQGSLAGAA